ncbi:MAG: T9SS type A sorting domain-containing protein [Bacteroidetes bacterium]|nr:T9SS C-terminal target domain-containing protein [Bacteroidota bacterium]NOG94430.1 T9SS type A sorting domain-containing protein [Bacteroidota bacterium]GIK69723.1 MAG: hypothetical protein BroJett020_10180 [Bacteroidota bacterium]
MNKSIFVFCICLCVGIRLFAQKPDIKRTYHWYFGEKAGLDFSNNNVVKDVSSQMNAIEGCATISDTCGNLLLYSNGDTVWNYNHQIVLNGTGLMGCYSSTQAVAIVPQPLNDSLFYVFTTDCGENAGANGLRYSVININGNSGNGEIILKNQLLYQPCSEKMTVTHHANGTDYWIVSHEYYSSRFFSYQLSSTGISLPVISIEGVNTYQFGSGQLTISPNGSKIATSYYLPNVFEVDTLEIYDFDNTSGIISNTISLQLDTSDQAYGISFSPNGNILYAATFNSNGDLLTQLWQYDVSSNNQTTIQNSRTEIFNSMNHWLYQMQLGVDGRIYIAKDGTQFADSLGVINFPNQLGSACGFSLNEYDFSGYELSVGLPNFPNSYFNNTSWLPNCSVGISELTADNKLIMYPNPASNYVVIEAVSDMDFANLKITNIQGKDIPIKIISQNQNSIVLDITNLSNGLYFIIINNQNLSFTHKFLKL